MEIRSLRYFAKIVETGSFCRAAELTFIAQPALSRRIAELENQLGLTLLERSSRGVRPTAAGQALYREAILILRQMDNIPSLLRFPEQEAVGVVNVGICAALSSAFAGALLSRCKAELPGVTIRLFSDNSTRLNAWVDNRTLDLAIVIEGHGAMKRMCKPLFRQRLHVVYHPSLGALGSEVSLGDLARLPLILCPAPDVAREALEHVLISVGLEPYLIMQADLFSMLAAVQAGVGYAAMLPGTLAQWHQGDTLTATPIDPSIFLTASVVSSSDVSLSRVAEQVRDILIQVARDSKMDDSAVSSANSYVATARRSVAA